MLTAVYVAFTGWETVAFTFEEHRRPDLIPRIFAASYLIVVALSGLLLLSLFAVVDSHDPALDSAPLLLLAERSLGSLGRPIMLLLAVACITANVFASVFALSAGDKYVILDMSDLTSPRFVSEYDHPDSRIHAVWVHDGRGRPVFASDSTQPCIRDLALRICLSVKKSSARTLSTG